MKKLYILSCVGALLLNACANNPVVKQSAQASMSPTPIHSESVAKRLNDCIIRSNQSADALLVDRDRKSTRLNSSH